MKYPYILQMFKFIIISMLPKKDYKINKKLRCWTI